MAVGTTMWNKLRVLDQVRNHEHEGVRLATDEEFENAPISIELIRYTDDYYPKIALRENSH